MDCSRLGTILYPDIQKSKEATKIAKYQQEIGGTAVFMKRLMMAKKGYGQLTSNYTYFYDIWFSGVKTADEEMAQGVDYCGPAKMSHKGFCLATL